jgi:hypothetical protein
MPGIASPRPEKAGGIVSEKITPSFLAAHNVAQDPAQDTVLKAFPAQHSCSICVLTAAILPDKAEWRFSFQPHCRTARSRSCTAVSVFCEKFRWPPLGAGVFQNSGDVSGECFNFAPAFPLRKKLMISDNRISK